MSTEAGRIEVAEAAGREFFVSIVDGGRKGLLAGPFADHATAESYVAPARALAEKIAPMQAAFAGFGTCSLPAGSGRTGRLNTALEITV